MRALAIVVAAAFLAVPAAAPIAAGVPASLTGAQLTDISAASKTTKKKAKPKVEYMRAVPVK